MFLCISRRSLAPRFCRASVLAPTPTPCGVCRRHHYHQQQRPPPRGPATASTSTQPPSSDHIRRMTAAPAPQRTSASPTLPPRVPPRMPVRPGSGPVVFGAGGVRYPVAPPHSAVRGAPPPMARSSRMVPAAPPRSPIFARVAPPARSGVFSGKLSAPPESSSSVNSSSVSEKNASLRRRASHALGAPMPGVSAKSTLLDELDPAQRSPGDSPSTLMNDTSARVDTRTSPRKAPLPPPLPGRQLTAKTKGRRAPPARKSASRPSGSGSGRKVVTLKVASTKLTRKDVDALLKDFGPVHRVYFEPTEENSVVWIEADSNTADDIHKSFLDTARSFDGHRVYANALNKNRRQWTVNEAPPSRVLHISKAARKGLPFPGANELAKQVVTPFGKIVNILKLGNAVLIEVDSLSAAKSILERQKEQWTFFGDRRVFMSYSMHQALYGDNCVDDATVNSLNQSPKETAAAPSSPAPSAPTPTPTIPRSASSELSSTTPIPADATSAAAPSPGRDARNLSPPASAPAAGTAAVAADAVASPLSPVATDAVGNGSRPPSPQQQPPSPQQPPPTPLQQPPPGPLQQPPSSQQPPPTPLQQPPQQLHRQAPPSLVVHRHQMHRQESALHQHTLYLKEVKQAIERAKTQAELCTVITSKCTPAALLPAPTAAGATRADILANIDGHAMSLVLASLRRLAALVREGGADAPTPTLGEAATAPAGDAVLRTALAQLSQVVSKVSAPVVEPSRAPPRMGSPAPTHSSLNAKRIAELGEALRLCVAAKVANKQFVSDAVLKLHDCFTGVSSELSGGAKDWRTAAEASVPPPQVLCQLLWSLVKLEFRDDSLFRKVEKVVASARVPPAQTPPGVGGAQPPVPLLSQFSPLQLSIWVWAFASRDIKPNAYDREFGELLRTCVADAIPMLKPAEVITTACALQHLDLSPNKDTQFRARFLEHISKSLSASTVLASARNHGTPPPSKSQKTSHKASPAPSTSTSSEAATSSTDNASSSAGESKTPLIDALKKLPSVPLSISPVNRSQSALTSLGISAVDTTNNTDASALSPTNLVDLVWFLSQAREDHVVSRSFYWTWEPVMLPVMKALSCDQLVRLITALADLKWQPTRACQDAYFDAVRPKLEAAYTELRSGGGSRDRRASNKRKREGGAESSASAASTDVDADPMSAAHLEEIFSALKRLRAEITRASPSSKRHAPWYRNNSPMSPSPSPTAVKGSPLPFLGARWESMLSTAALRLRVRDNPFEQMQIGQQPHSGLPFDGRNIDNVNLPAEVLADGDSSATAKKRRPVLDAMREPAASQFYGGAFNVERRLLVLVGVDKSKAIEAAYVSGVYRRASPAAASSAPGVDGDKKASYADSRAANAIRSIVERYGPVEWIRNTKGKGGHGKEWFVQFVRAEDAALASEHLAVPFITKVRLQALRSMVCHFQLDRSCDLRAWHLLLQGIEAWKKKVITDKSKHVDVVHAEDAYSVAFAGSAETLTQLRYGILDALRGYNVVATTSPTPSNAEKTPEPSSSPSSTTDASPSPTPSTPSPSGITPLGNLFMRYTYSGDVKCLRYESVREAPAGAEAAQGGAEADAKAQSKQPPPVVGVARHVEEPSVIIDGTEVEDDALSEPTGALAAGAPPAVVPSLLLKHEEKVRRYTWQRANGVAAPALGAPSARDRTGSPFSALLPRYPGALSPSSSALAPLVPSAPSPPLHMPADWVRIQKAEFSPDLSAFATHELSQMSHRITAHPLLIRLLVNSGVIRHLNRQPTSSPPTSAASSPSSLAEVGAAARVDVEGTFESPQALRVSVAGGSGALVPPSSSSSDEGAASAAAVSRASQRIEDFLSHAVIKQRKVHLKHARVAWFVHTHRTADIHSHIQRAVKQAFSNAPSSRMQHSPAAHSGGNPPVEECLPFEHGVALSVSSVDDQTSVTVATFSERAQQVALSAMRDYLARFHSLFLDLTAHQWEALDLLRGASLKDTLMSEHGVAQAPGSTTVKDNAFERRFFVGDKDNLAKAVKVYEDAVKSSIYELPFHLNTTLTKQSMADFVSLLEHEASVRVHVSESNKREEASAPFDGNDDGVTRFSAQVLPPHHAGPAPPAQDSVVLTLRGNLGAVHDAQKIVRVANKMGYTSDTLMLSPAQETALFRHLGPEFLKGLTKRFAVYVHFRTSRSHRKSSSSSSSGETPAASASVEEADSSSSSSSGGGGDSPSEAAVGKSLRVLLFGAKEQMAQAKNVIVEQLNDMKFMYIPLGDLPMSFFIGDRGQRIKLFRQQLGVEFCTKVPDTLAVFGEPLKAMNAHRHISHFLRPFKVQRYDAPADVRAQFSKKANLATIMELKRTHSVFFDVNDGADEMRVVYPREKTEEVLPVVQRLLNLKAREGGAPASVKSDKQSTAARQEAESLINVRILNAKTVGEVFLACDPVTALTPPVFTAVFATLASHRFKDTILKATTTVFPQQDTAPARRGHRQEAAKRGAGNSANYMKLEDINRHLNPLLSAFEKKLAEFPPDGRSLLKCFRSIFDIGVRNPRLVQSLCTLIHPSLVPQAAQSGNGSASQFPTSVSPQTTPRFVLAPNELVSIYKMLAWNPKDPNIHRSLRVDAGFWQLLVGKITASLLELDDAALMDFTRALAKSGAPLSPAQRDMVPVAVARRLPHATPFRFRIFVDSMRKMKLYNAALLKVIEDIATRSLAMGVAREWKDFETVLMYYLGAQVPPSDDFTNALQNLRDSVIFSLSWHDCASFTWLVRRIPLRLPLVFHDKLVRQIEFSLRSTPKSDVSEDELSGVCQYLQRLEDYDAHESIIADADSQALLGGRYDARRGGSRHHRSGGSELVPESVLDLIAEYAVPIGPNLWPSLRAFGLLTHYGFSPSVAWRERFVRVFADNISLVGGSGVGAAAGANVDHHVLKHLLFEMGRCHETLALAPLPAVAEAEEEAAAAAEGGRSRLEESDSRDCLSVILDAVYEKCTSDTQIFHVDELAKMAAAVASLRPLSSTSSSTAPREGEANTAGGGAGAEERRARNLVSTFLSIAVIHSFETASFATLTRFVWSSMVFELFISLQSQRLFDAFYKALLSFPVEDLGRHISPEERDRVYLIMLMRAFLQRQEELVAEKSAAASSSPLATWARQIKSAASGGSARRRPSTMFATSTPAPESSSPKTNDELLSESSLPITTESFSSRTRRSLTNFFFGAAPPESAFPLSSSSSSAGTSGGGSSPKSHSSSSNDLSSTNKKMQIRQFRSLSRPASSSSSSYSSYSSIERTALDTSSSSSSSSPYSGSGVGGLDAELCEALREDFVTADFARVRSKEADIFPLCESLERAGFQPLPAYLCDYTGIHADVALEQRGILITLPEKRLLDDADAGDADAALGSVGAEQRLRRLNPNYLSPGMVALRRKLHTLAGWRVVELTEKDVRHVDSVGFWEEKLGEE